MKNKGFTLIELIVTVVILSVIGVFSFQFITGVLGMYVEVSAEEDIAREARLALERMSREVRDALNIVSPAAGGSGGSIVFTRTATATDSSTQVTYQLSGGVLQRQRDSNTPEPLASNVGSFTVTRSSGNGELITLDLTLAGQYSVRQRTVIYPRYFKYQ